MKRWFVLLVVLLPVCWFAVGCGKGGAGVDSATEVPSKEQMDKMLEGQRQIEMAKQKESSPQPK